jgi:CBS domain-containing protein
MTAAELITTQLPVLQLTDTAADALHKMQEHRLSEIPVINGNQLAGLVREEEVEDAAPDSLLSLLEDDFDRSAVRPGDFFLSLLKLMRQRDLQLVPVVEEERGYLGAVTVTALLQAAAQYTSSGEPGGVIILQLLPHQFSISEIGRIVESNDARVIHLNTWTESATGHLMVAIKVNKTEIQDILASLERYEYTVVRFFGENQSEDVLRMNFDHLMNYLRM